MTYHDFAFRRDGQHLSHASDQTHVAFAFYNVGLQNDMILARSWNRASSDKQKKLRDDIMNIFRNEQEIQCLFLSGFGRMDVTIDNVLHNQRLHNVLDGLPPPTQQYFEQLVEDINLTHLVVRAIAPYIALIDSTYWMINECVPLEIYCSRQENFVMNLLLQHKENGKQVAVCNCNISSRATRLQREHSIKTIVGTLAMRDTLRHCVIGGICNLDAEMLFGF